MSEQLELLPKPRDFHPDLKLREPHVWIRELRVLRSLAPGAENVLRCITLQPGLNILWARPVQRGKPARLHAPGVSGHASGKTTFCRFLRHLLGEPNFGTDEQRERLRIKFPDGWVVGEVRLAEQSWLIARPFKVGPHPFVIRGEGIDTIFSAEAARLPITDYQSALDRALAEPLPVATFATSPTPISWPHLMQWLARDQESRFAGLADLRHSTSESLSPDMSVEDRHFLFRATLDLINVTEQAELEKNKALVVKKQKADKGAPLLRFRSKSALDRLRAKLPDFQPEPADLSLSESKDPDPSDEEARKRKTEAAYLKAVELEFTKKAKAAETAQRQMLEPETLKVARAKQAEAADAKRGAEQHLKEINDTVSLIEQQLKVLSGESTQADMDTWIREKLGDRFCGQPLTSAIEWDCPLVRGRKLPIEKKTAALVVAPTAEELGKRVVAEKARGVAAQDTVTRHEATIAERKLLVQAETRTFDAQRGKFATESAEFTAIAEEAKNAFADAAEAQEFEESLTDLEQQIRKSQELQATIREKQSATLSAFSDTFARVTRAVLGDDVDGSIKFRGRQIRPTLSHGIDLTSAALETLKIICFDLAALISGVEDRGAHPRFLIHDGPREADMDAELHQRLFLLAAELETPFGDAPKSFQYIVTTTEPPPETLQTSPWLIDPVLDASNASGKLLGEDF